MESYSQFRNVEVEYKIVSPDSGSLFISPSKIPVAFIIYNYGPDSLYATDSFTYFISHSIDYPNKEIKKRLTLGKDMAPGDSSVIYRDTSFVNWTYDKKTFVFQLSVLVSYFTEKMRNNFNFLNVTPVPDQNKKGKVQLRHNYLSSVNPLQNNQYALVVYPNPLLADELTVRLGLKSQTLQPSFALINYIGVKTSLRILNTMEGSYTLDLSNLPNGMYFLVSEFNGKEYINKLILLK